MDDQKIEKRGNEEEQNTYGVVIAIVIVVALIFFGGWFFLLGQGSNNGQFIEEPIENTLENTIPSDPTQGTNPVLNSNQTLEGVIELEGNLPVVE